MLQSELFFISIAIGSVILGFYLGVEWCRKCDAIDRLVDRKKLNV